MIRSISSANGNHPYSARRNAERVEKEKFAPINVVIGNPPYNVGQLNENDNNKNRKYPVIETRIKETYAKDSVASNKNALSDAYVKFFRWADGPVAGPQRHRLLCQQQWISVWQIAFDGIRKHLLKDFDTIYHFDLKGNVSEPR